MSSAITLISVAVFPILGAVAVWAGIRGILSRRVAWNRSRELVGGHAVAASVFMLVVGLTVLFLSACYWSVQG